MNSANNYDHNIQTLQVYLYYRVVLSGLLFTMFSSGLAANVLGVGFGQLYFWASIIYFGSTLATLFAFPASALRSSRRRIGTLLWIDIIALLILIHASGGIESGLGYLLIISAATVTIFVQRQLALAYAATITIVIIVDTVYLSRFRSDLSKHIFTSGTLGILIFATTIALGYLSDKLRKASAQSEAQARQVKNLLEIAQNIVTRMQTGVIVTDNDLRIELMNASAKLMLDLPRDKKLYGTYLADLRELLPLLKDWESTVNRKKSTVLKIRPGMDIRVNVAHLDSGDIQKNIFYLEDYAAIRQQAQQLKLASLGRLAASIAHEIRNPLGAISHAAQLLDESDSLPKSDQRMAEIILNNSRRVNEIVENTLALSRRREPHPEQLDISLWLPGFINELKSSREKNIQLNIKKNALYIKFDPTHLRQILTNLVENGLRFSSTNNGESAVEVIAGEQSNDHKTYVEIVDSGPGIPQKHINEIYEPFFTTDDKGSGLGLYICKELAEINHASLHYRRTSDNKTCFRLDFSHHQRMQ